MGRLPGFDYKRPFFYMVTLKKAAVGDASIGAFSEIAEGEVVANAVVTNSTLRHLDCHLEEAMEGVGRDRAS